jgi:hypothetical protein
MLTSLACGIKTTENFADLYELRLLKNTLKGNDMIAEDTHYSWKMKGFKLF